MDLSVSGVSERDIDLFLLYSLIHVPGFLSGFLHTIGYESFGKGDIVFGGRSVTQSIGESDLELLIQCNDKTLCLMIENKINAGVQPQQAQRYIQRGKNNISQGKCDEFVSVLVAPEVYLRGCDDFSLSISYETIVKLLNKDNRYNFIEYMLEQAIAKSSVGYSPVADQPVTDFWYSYYQLVSQNFSHFNMKKPSQKPSTSSFVYFHPVELPPGVVMVHKFVHGYFGTTARKARDFHALSKVYSHIDESRSHSNIFGSSAYQPICISKLDPVLGFDAQYNLLLNALNTGSLLLDYFLRVKDILPLK